MTKRRSRRLSPGRVHTSAKTKSSSCGVDGVASSGAANVITSAKARLPRSARSVSIVVMKAASFRCVIAG